MKRIRYVFYVAIYLSGILIGGIYTREVIAYSKQASSNDQQHNDQEIEKTKKVKPAPVKKRYRVRVV